MYTIKWLGEKLSLIDQTLLPQEEIYRTCDTLEEVHAAIREMVVRGAPALGIAAAYAMVLAASSCPQEKIAFLTCLRKKGQYLASARPTAINLAWAIKRMIGLAETLVESYETIDYQALLSKLEEEANLIYQEDVLANKAIGENLLSLLKPGDGVLTHCNAGALATAAYGTATAPFYLAKERSIPLSIYIDETRPRLQGAKLTAFELQRLGADATLICDNMAAAVMAAGKIQACITGCDRVAANGDTANKIGTLNVAILANYFQIPFYIAAPSSTIDLASASGDQIPIEERDLKEIKIINGSYICPPGIRAYNPSFDVTPAELITAIVTEKEIIRPPYLGRLNI